MVVAKLDVVGVTRLEPEADAPLVVDRDGELPTTVAAERVQPIAGWYPQVVHVVAASTASSFRSARRTTSGGTRRARPVTKSSSVRRSANDLITHQCNAARDAWQAGDRPLDPHENLVSHNTGIACGVPAPVILARAAISGTPPGTCRC